MNGLEIDNVSLSFGGLKAVDGLSFSVEPGSVFTIIGPNGAGKSTVFNLICRIYDPSQGDIRFNGKSLRKAKSQPWHCADVPEHRTVRTCVIA